MINWLLKLIQIDILSVVFGKLTLLKIKLILVIHYVLQTRIILLNDQIMFLLYLSLPSNRLQSLLIVSRDNNLLNPLNEFQVLIQNTLFFSVLIIIINIKVIYYRLKHLIDHPVLLFVLIKRLLNLLHLLIFNNFLFLGYQRAT